ncbi:hypothetical protein FB451DRAFT_1172900 [Mycena latifolia]|nr:hypothetical protein FB451DRAFT_1172900 [Mycena latifolia]
MGDAALARARTRGLLACRICAVQGLSGVGLAGTCEVGSGRVEPCGSRGCIGVGHAAAFPVSLPHPSLFNPLLNFVNSPGHGPDRRERAGRGQARGGVDGAGDGAAHARTRRGGRILCAVRNIRAISYL